MFSLEQFFVPQLFAALLIFTRVGSGIMMMPGLAEGTVSLRARLLLALSLAVLLTPVLSGFMPPVPGAPFALAVLLTGEIFIGAMIGTVARFLISTLHVAGTIISTQSSLSMATQFDPTQAMQGTLLGNFMSTTAVVVMFAVDLHLVMLRGLTDSYTLFMPGDFPPVEDFTAYLTMVLSHAFEVAFRLSAPVVVLGLLLYYASGILNRLMPSIQVFFIILPVQVMLSLVILLSVFGALIMNYTQFFADVFGGFLEDIG
jgi:flagellar biosynthetic protein FliR